MNMRTSQAGHIGLHIRPETTFTNIAMRAQEFGITLFQTFPTLHDGKRIPFCPIDRAQFKNIIHNNSMSAYVHGSYWVNPSSKGPGGTRIFKEEVKRAYATGFTHYVFHSGSAKEHKDKDVGIATLAHNTNTILETVPDIQLVLENTAHAGFTVGSDIRDFGRILERINNPDRLSFCIDTAHAYAYGYDIRTESGLNSFIECIDTTIGINRIALIHLNDTDQHVGSHIDHHVIPGEGLIGSNALQQCINHPALHTVPVILELPAMPEHQQLSILTTVQSWRT